MGEAGRGSAGLEVPRLEVPRLEVSGLEAGYGQVQVLWGIDLLVRPGETVVLLGANGAGKTTLLRTLIGLNATWRGAIGLDGAAIAQLRPDARVRRGMAFMSEQAVFGALTIEENIRVSAPAMSRSAFRALTDELFATFPILADRRRAPAGSLSGGQRKMLGIAKALASRPKLLVMDEPSAGLSPLFVKEVVKVLGETRRRAGLAMLIAEQNVKFLKLADRVYTIDHGRIAFEGAPAALEGDGALRRAVFGLG